MSENFKKDRMKCSESHSCFLLSAHLQESFLHFGGSGFCECDDENMNGLYSALFDQILGPVGNDRSFPGTGAG